MASSLLYVRIIIRKPWAINREAKLSRNRRKPSDNDVLEDDH